MNSSTISGNEKLQTEESASFDRSLKLDAKGL